MLDGPTKEIKEQPGFPPQPGELMIRRTFYGNPGEIPGNTDWRMESEELRWFDEVSQPGDNWHYQQIAKVHYGGSSGEPNFGSGVESATDSQSVIWSKTTKVEHKPASNKDLARITYLVARFYKEKHSGSEGKEKFRNWLEEIKQNNSLLETEKTRLETAANLQLSTDYFERPLEPTPSHF